MFRISTLALMFLFVTTAIAGENLLRNGDFSDGTSKWSVKKKQSTEVVELSEEGDPAKALKVEIVTDGGKSYGEIRQNIKVKPGTDYVLTGKQKSTKANLAFFQIKLRKDRKEIERIKTAASTLEWQEVTKEFNTSGANEVQVLCRYRQSEKHNWVGHTAWFADLALTEKE